MKRRTAKPTIESNDGMDIVVAGGSGFLGGALVQALRSGGHQVSILTRRPVKPGDVQWNPAETGAWVPAVQGADAVVNLAGEAIAGARWTPARKKMLRDSRLVSTRAIARAILSAARPPVLLSASGIGYYGTHDEQPLTEDSPPGEDFLATLCQEWERAALDAASVTRVVLLRTGVVLGTGGGALAELARPFKLFAGGPIGSGSQFVSWVHLDDWVGLAQWAIATPAVAGPLNLTAPTPVTNADLAHALGTAMHRPSFVAAPAFAVRLIAGEMADAAILNGQRVLPAKALAHGYRFEHPTIESALHSIFAPAG